MVERRRRHRWRRRQAKEKGKAAAGGEEGQRRRSQRRGRRRRQSLSAGLSRTRLVAPLPPACRFRRVGGASLPAESERGVVGGRWPGSAGASNGEVLRVAQGAPDSGAGAAARPPASRGRPPPPTHTHRSCIDGNVCEETAETQ